MCFIAWYIFPRFFLTLETANTEETVHLIQAITTLTNYTSDKIFKIKLDLFEKSLKFPLSFGLDTSTLKSQCILKCAKLKIDLKGVPDDIQVTFYEFYLEIYIE
jgi:hypothetical protein